MFLNHTFSGSALHKFIFFPNKLKIRSSADIKSSSAGASTVTGSTSQDTKSLKGQHTLETVMFRLATFIASAVSLPFKPLHDVRTNKLASLLW